MDSKKDKKSKTKNSNLSKAGKSLSGKGDDFRQKTHDSIKTPQNIENTEGISIEQLHEGMLWECSTSYLFVFWESKE